MSASLFAKLAAVVTVFGLLLAMTSPAGAEPQSFKNSFDAEFDDVVCKIPVHVTITGFEIVHIQESVIPDTGPESDAFWIAVFQHHAVFKFTNADGVTITSTYHETVQEDSMVDNGDGTWTYTYAINGMARVLRTGHGQLYKDVGRITIQDVIYLGDLSTIEDNEMVSSQILGIQGPHPGADSDFELFCEVFTEIMG